MWRVAAVCLGIASVLSTVTSRHGAIQAEIERLQVLQSNLPEPSFAQHALQRSSSQHALQRSSSRQAGGASSNDPCCNPGGVNVCKDALTMECLCKIDEYCCSMEFDDQCVDEAKEDCGHVCSDIASISCEEALPLSASIRSACISNVDPIEPSDGLLPDDAVIPQPTYTPTSAPLPPVPSGNNLWLESGVQGSLFILKKYSYAGAYASTLASNLFSSSSPPNTWTQEALQDLSNQIAGVSAQVVGIQKQVNQLQSSLNELAIDVDVVDLNIDWTNVQNQLDTIETQYAQLAVMLQVPRNYNDTTVRAWYEIIGNLQTQLTSGIESIGAVCTDLYKYGIDSLVSLSSIAYSGAYGLTAASRLFTKTAGKIFVGQMQCTVLTGFAYSGPISVNPNAYLIDVKAVVLQTQMMKLNGKAFGTCSIRLNEACTGDQADVTWQWVPYDDAIDDTLCEKVASEWVEKCNGTASAVSKYFDLGYMSPYLNRWIQAEYTAASQGKKGFYTNMIGMGGGAYRGFVASVLNIDGSRGFEYASDVPFNAVGNQYGQQETYDSWASLSLMQAFTYGGKHVSQAWYVEPNIEVPGDYKISGHVCYEYFGNCTFADQWWLVPVGVNPTQGYPYQSHINSTTNQIGVPASFKVVPLSKTGIGLLVNNPPGNAAQPGGSGLTLNSDAYGVGLFAAAESLSYGGGVISFANFNSESLTKNTRAQFSFNLVPCGQDPHNCLGPTAASPKEFKVLRPFFNIVYSQSNDEDNAAAYSAPSSTTATTAYNYAVTIGSGDNAITCSSSSRRGGREGRMRHGRVLDETQYKCSAGLYTEYLSSSEEDEDGAAYPSQQFWYADPTALDNYDYFETHKMTPSKNMIRWSSYQPFSAGLLAMPGTCTCKSTSTDQCDWTSQDFQCMGLTNDPTATSADDCSKACCKDTSCTVWQYEVWQSGQSQGCWRGASCGTGGSQTTWIGGQLANDRQASTAPQPGWKSQYSVQAASGGTSGSGPILLNDYISDISTESDCYAACNQYKAQAAYSTWTGCAFQCNGCYLGFETYLVTSSSEDSCFQKAFNYPVTETTQAKATLVPCDCVIGTYSFTYGSETAASVTLPAKKANVRASSTAEEGKPAEVRPNAAWWTVSLPDVPIGTTTTFQYGTT